MPDPTPLRRAAAPAVELDRRIGADPASAALLCAGPGVAELWPGVTRGGHGDDTVRVARRRRTPHVLSLRTTAPRRTPTAFVCGFEVAEDGRQRLTGRLELAYDDRPGGVPGTRARLVLDPARLGRAEQTEVARGAQRFLANLARAAEKRAGAA